MLRKVAVEPLEIRIVLQFPCVCSAYPDVRLYDDRETANLIKELTRRFNSCDLVIACSRNAGLLIERLHRGFALPHRELFRLNT